MLNDVEKESLGLGVHLEYELDHFQQGVDEFMPKFEWRVDGYGPATLDGFTQHQKLLSTLFCYEWASYESCGSETKTVESSNRDLQF